jgi:transposase
MQKKKQTTMPIINVNAAGIDVGSRSHFIAVGQNPEDVKEFGVDTEGHQAAIAFLKSNQITTIAMESTGSYWQSLFNVLQEAEFEVLLVPGNQTKNSRGKTDVKDCQWIQKLHSLGLLSGSFLPDEQTMKLRTIQRHRASLIETAAKYTNKIQKALRLMNIRLDVCIRDIVGKTGRAIIESILAGERNPSELVKLVDIRVKKSKQEIEKNLHGQWSEELLYELKDCYDLLNVHENKIKDCDFKIDSILQQQTKHIKFEVQTPLAIKQKKGKHQCKIDLQKYCYQVFGTDIFLINGVSVGAALTLISEIGLSIYKFENPKKFTSWLRLSPNNKISGGRILSSRTLKSNNALSKVLRDCANAIGLSKNEDYLTFFFRRIAYKKGRGAAITATARKIAVILWNMIVKKQPYNPIGKSEFLMQQKQRKINFLKKDMRKYGISFDELSAT